MRLLKPSALTLAITLALAACESSTLDTTIATETPGVASITVSSVVDNQATVDWNLTSGTFAVNWRLYQNELRVCSGDPITVAANAASPSYQTGGCTITLQVGSNDVQVQLCNSDDSSYCSYSPTELIDYQQQSELGAIAWQDFPSSSSTSDDEHYLSWSKGEGVNGDYWHIYQNDAIACSDNLSYSETLGAQSGGCDVTLAQGANIFQAQLCQSQPVGIGDNCVQSPSASLTFAPAPERILARAVIEELDESLPASYDLTISWSKDTSSGSAGEDWNFSNNGEVICQGVLASGATSASCVTQLVEGSNQLQVRLCTDIETYSGASCDYSSIVTVEGFDPNPLEPGTIAITNSLPEQVTDEPGLTIDWRITDGNGVSSWSVSANGSIYCATTSLDQYHQSGSCPIALDNGTNSISVTGCNYGYDNSESCATSATVSTEYIESPGTPDITSSLAATTYASEHNLSWERVEGAAADYWLALVNDTSQCSDDLVRATPQSGSCVIELASGVNTVAVRLCIANESGSAYCSDSESAQIELLAPVPTQPEISTAAQTIADDTILIEWSKSSGDNGSYWSLTNNNASVAACADQPLLSSGSSQSGSCDLPLELGTNLITVRLCNDNAAGTASCSTSESVIITRESAAPEFTSASSASVAENTGEVFYTTTVSDADSSMEQISFALSGLDSAHFNLDSANGELSFKQAPDFESPQDQNQDNTYELNISASDPLETTALEFSVSVIDSNDEAPQVPSSEASTAHAISEITLDSLIYTVEASDADADDILTYSLSGADASHFSLNSSSGELRFTTLPSLEQPQDANGDNIYDLAISVSDAAANSTSFELVVTVVDDIGSAPQFDVTSASVEFPENQTDLLVYAASATDPDGDAITYSLGGVDFNLFIIDVSSGAVSFASVPDYDNPLDNDKDNNYSLSIFARDAIGNQSELALSVLVTAVNSAPTFANSTPDPIALPENTSATTTIYTASASDADDDPITYSLGGIDLAHFNLGPTDGELSFQQALDFETPQDHDQDNTYELEISASDATTTASIALNVSITNVNDNQPTFTDSTTDPISLPENTSAATTIYTAAASDADGDLITYSLSGIDSSHFGLDSSSGELSFQSAPDHETPLDQDADNDYQLSITATDTDYSSSQDLTISVTDINDESPQFTSPNSLSINYSDISVGASVYTAQATDADLGDQITYSLGGADASHFSFDSSSGALAFSQQPSRDNPQDANADNRYAITITATDLADNSSTLDLSINVVDDSGSAPTFAQASASVNVDENSADSIYTAQATDTDSGDILTYSISGLDAALFSIGSANGELSFRTAPDYENPTDQGADNTYELDIIATDTIGNQAQHSLTVSVNNLNDNQPQFNLSSNSFDVPENTTAITTIAASDADGDELSFALITTSDSSHFTLDPTSGILAFAQAPDFDSPQDSDTDNIYQLDLSAADGSHTTTQAITIEVTNVDEAPQFASASDTIEVSENTVTTIYTAAASDDDGDAITYALSGTDSAHLILDSATGDLSFSASPNYEIPQDHDGSNDYQLEIQATSTNYSSTLQLGISVSNVEEAPSASGSTSADITEDPATEGLVAVSAQFTPQPQFFDEEDFYIHGIGPIADIQLTGDDAEDFSMSYDSDGVVSISFKISPDYDNPHDADQDNYYDFALVATDSAGKQTEHDLTVAIAGLNDESPYLQDNSQAVSSDPDAGDRLYYSVELVEYSASVFYIIESYDPDLSSHEDGYQYNLATDERYYELIPVAGESDEQFFELNYTTGELRANTGLGYNHRQDSDGDGVYKLHIRVSDMDRYASDHEQNNVNDSSIYADDEQAQWLYVTLIETLNDVTEAVDSGPQIPWFYSDVSVGESVDIPWVIYAGEGAHEWELYVNNELVCHELAGDASSEVHSGVCSVPASELVVGVAANKASVKTYHAHGVSAESESVSFGYAVSSLDGYYPEIPNVTPDAAACAAVNIGEPVNSFSHAECYAYLLSDDAFGGPYNQIPSYLYTGSGRSFEVIAYFIEWGIYARDFAPHDLPANLLSTALYSFLKFDGDNNSDECETCTFSGDVAIADEWAAFDKAFYKPGDEELYGDQIDTYGTVTGKGIFQQFWLLKQKFPHLKTCLSVGGWSFSRPFPLVAKDINARGVSFARSVVDLAHKYHFDCIDIDWEFPIIGGGDYKVTDSSGNPSYDYDGDGITPFVAPSDKDSGYFHQLVYELYKEIEYQIFTYQASESLDINSAMYAGEYGMSKMNYELFADYLYGIHLMTYDFYGAWDPYTGMQAALYYNNDPLHPEVSVLYPDAYNNQHNIASAMTRAVNNALNNGFSSNTQMRQKMVPGLAFYGRNYSGVYTQPEPGQYMVLAQEPAEQLGWEPGNLNYAQLEGYYDHGDIVLGNADYVADMNGDGSLVYSTADRSWTYNWDPQSETPFLYDDATNSFVSYTDPRAIYYQTCHAAWQNSKGVMFWEISGDSKDFDLVNAIHTAVRGAKLEQYDQPPSCADVITIGSPGEVVSGLLELEQLNYINQSVFDQMFPYANDLIDDGVEAYTWSGLKQAATAYPDFVGSGDVTNGADLETRLRELAAFLAITAERTNFGVSSTSTLGDMEYQMAYIRTDAYCAPGGSGYGSSDCHHCDSTNNAYDYACDWLDTAEGNYFYYPRGPMQMLYNTNYGDFSSDYYADDRLLYNADAVHSDSTIGFASAIWLWMNGYQDPRAGDQRNPSGHDIMTGQFAAEASAGRYPGYGMIINAYFENGYASSCGDIYDANYNNPKIGYYLTFLKILEQIHGSGISPWVPGYGSSPATASAFPTDTGDFVSVSQDSEDYLSCKNMDYYGKY